MTEKPLSTVWIIGSGFSKSLGGPLLYDLLSDRAAQETLARFPSLDAGLVHRVFSKHRQGGSGGVYGEPVCWEHAEEFLSFIDTAVKPDSARRRILGGWLANANQTVETFRKLAIRAIAAECLFTLDADTDDEAWGPYKQWGRSIGAPDAIITFNYDLALETLGLVEGTKLSPQTVLLPNATDTILMDATGAVPILKLHGSVDWFTEDDPARLSREVDCKAAIDTGRTPLIATPGPTKQLHCTGLLAPLWRKAAAYLKKADVIVFLGYRFPPSDSEARSFLLGALREPTPVPYRRIHTVLGPRTGDEATVRIVKLLRTTLEGAGWNEFSNDRYRPNPGADRYYRVIPQPLYVEDYLSVLHEDELYGAKPV